MYLLFHRHTLEWIVGASAGLEPKLFVGLVDSYIGLRNANFLDRTGITLCAHFICISKSVHMCAFMRAWGRACAPRVYVDLIQFI